MLDLKAFVRKEFESSIQTKMKLLENPEIIKTVAKIAEVCIHSFKNGGKLLFAGNGGSAADAQHISAEFVSRFYFDRPGLPSISLSSDPSVVTAIGNDYGYENLFARQIQAYGKPGDVLIAISTSGKSPNVLKGIATAKAMGLITVAFTSEKGGDMAEVCDYAIQAPSSSTPNIQECHITIGHAICAGVEEALFRK